MKLLLSGAIFIITVIGSVSAQSAPIVVSQTIRLTNFNHYGIEAGLLYSETAVGDWVLKATLDSESTPINSIAYFSTDYRLDKVTLTQASLGIEDVLITNMAYLRLYTNGFGFITTPVSAGEVSSQMGYWPNPFYTLDTPPSLTEFLDLLKSSPISHASILPSNIEFDLADGRKIYGTGEGYGIASITAVPEPSIYLSLFVGLGILGLVRNKKTAFLK